MNEIRLNDILNIKDLSNVKIRFNLMFESNWNPIELFKSGETQIMLNGHYWNYNKNKSYKVGQITIGLIRIKPKEDLWLLIHVGRVTKDLNILNGVGYEFDTLPEFDKYIGRLVIRFKNNVQTMIRQASSVIDSCYISQILPDKFDNDLFPGYENVNLSWSDLKRVIDKEAWKTALQNQKGVYLITDINNGQMYVGAAYSDKMLFKRCKDYLDSGHGNNVKLKSLTFDYIKENFRFSILDIYKSTVDDQIIIRREEWWKSLLQTRKFGYNLN